MNEKQALIVAISLVVSALGTVGIFVLVWSGVETLGKIAVSLNLLGQETENLTSEVERLANEFENWNTAVEDELNRANEILCQKEHNK